MNARAAAVVVGFAADRVFGDPQRLHPVAGFGRLAQAAERAFWAHRYAAGVAYTALLVGGVTTVTTAVVHALSRRPLARFAFEAAVVWTVLGGRSLERSAARVAAALAEGDVAAARAGAGALVSRDVAALDPAELARATVESVAENTNDAVVAPLIWFAALGAPGAIAFRAANTLDAMVGYRSHRYARFGAASARLDDVLAWLPARASIVIVAACAPIVGGDARAAVAVATRDGPEHPSPNAGRVEGAFAGALALRLGGANHYAGRLDDRPQLGAGRAPTQDDVLRAMRLSRVTGFAAFVTAALGARAWTR